MSTIPRKFFSGALPGRPAAAAGNGALDARPLRVECAACARCVFAEHLNKGIFFAKHLRIACSAVAHRRTSKTSKRSLGGRFGIHESPTTGSRIRHRTTPFAQKVRKLFPPASTAADARNASMRMSIIAIRMRGAFRRCTRPVPNASMETANNECRFPKQVPMRTCGFAGSRDHRNGRRRSPDPETAMPARSDPAGIVLVLAERPEQRSAAWINGLRLPAIRRSRPDRAVR